jgi:hypothetical protein
MTPLQVELCRTHTEDYFLHRSALMLRLSKVYTLVKLSTLEATRLSRLTCTLMSVCSLRPYRPVLRLVLMKLTSSVTNQIRSATTAREY